MSSASLLLLVTAVLLSFRAALARPSTRLPKPSAMCTNASMLTIVEHMEYTMDEAIIPFGSEHFLPTTCPDELYSSISSNWLRLPLAVIRWVRAALLEASIQQMLRAITNASSECSEYEALRRPLEGMRIEARALQECLHCQRFRTACRSTQMPEYTEPTSQTLGRGGQREGPAERRDNCRRHSFLRSSFRGLLCRFHRFLKAFGRNNV